MKYSVLLLCLLGFSLLPTAFSEVPWLDGWNSRQLFYYQGNTTDFQHSLTVINQTNFNTIDTFYIYNETQTDFEDLRVTSSDGQTLIPVWNVTTNTGVNCTFWAKFPTPNASYFLYWNNPDAVNVWNQTAVFIDVISGVVLALPLDETASGTAIDYSGNGNNGVNTSTSIINSPFFSGTTARDFLGADYITITDIAAYSLTQITVELRFNVDDMTPLGALAGQRDANNVNASWTIFKGVSPELIRWQSTVNGNDGGSSVFNDANLADNTNYHLVCTMNNSHVQLYLDGLLECIPVALVGNLFNSTAAIRIGAVNAIPGSFLNHGVIGNFFIYNTALTATQISNLASGYPDPRIVAGSVFVREWGDSPQVNLFGDAETLDYSGVAFGVIAFLVACAGLALVVLKWKR